jgi:hypothetical protein
LTPWGFAPISCHKYSTTRGRGYGGGGGYGVESKYKTDVEDVYDYRRSYAINSIEEPEYDYGDDDDELWGEPDADEPEYFADEMVTMMTTITMTMTATSFIGKTRPDTRNAVIRRS